MSELAATEEVRRAARDAFLATYQQDAKVEALPMDASFRRYFRLHKGDGASLLLMDAPPPHEETAPFLSVAGWLAERGFAAPAVHANHASPQLPTSAGVPLAVA